MIGAIDVNLAVPTPGRRNGTGESNRVADFAKLMAQKAASPAAHAPRQQERAAPEPSGTSRLHDALADFRKEASMTRQERARRDVLEAMELTEEAIDAMPPEQQKATEDKIASEVARRLRLADDTAKGAPLSI